MKNRGKEILKAVRSFISTYGVFIVCAVLMTISFSDTVLAFDADAGWGLVKDLLTTWIVRIGGVVVIIGIVMFGLGWQRNDAEQKTQGISTAVGGIIVAAATALIDTFLA